MKIITNKNHIANFEKIAQSKTRFCSPLLNLRWYKLKASKSVAGYGDLGAEIFIICCL
ncbi:protein of unknown function [Agrobacterium pusense]|uniref:Uncharacterized protein n=1 Tax=Agrobacterium pusense TaxID=648995 RepID=U4PZH4_9HYPH|nr:protein of unknown function [Agrobacterium pusense]